MPNKNEQRTSVIIPAISPFQDESNVITIQDLSIENRTDRIQIHGALDITRDKEGLTNLWNLKRQIDAIAEYMKNAELPEQIEVLEAREVPNPLA